MYNVLICDDNKEYISYLKKILIKTEIPKNEFMFYEFMTGEDLIKYVNKCNSRCDLLLLDVQLPGMNGDETAELFRKKFPNAILVFCSGNCLPSDKSFKVMAYRYLYKSYSDEKMIDEIKEISEKMISNKVEPFIVGHYRYKSVMLRPSDILYIEICKRGSRIYICPKSDYCEYDGELICNEKLNYLHEQLKDFGFAYSHNSYIVNINYIRKITSNELFFIKWDKDEKERSLPISRSRSQEFRQIFARNLSRKY